MKKCFKKVKESIGIKCFEYIIYNNKIVINILYISKAYL